MNHHWHDIQKMCDSIVSFLWAQRRHLQMSVQSGTKWKKLSLSVLLAAQLSESECTKVYQKASCKPNQQNISQRSLSITPVCNVCLIHVICHLFVLCWWFIDFSKWWQLPVMCVFISVAVLVFESLIETILNVSHFQSLITGPVIVVW